MKGRKNKHSNNNTAPQQSTAAFASASASSNPTAVAVAADAAAAVASANVDKADIGGKVKAVNAAICAVKAAKVAIQKAVAKEKSEASNNVSSNDANKKDTVKGSMTTAAASPSSASLLQNSSSSRSGSVAKAKEATMAVAGGNGKNSSQDHFSHVCDNEMVKIKSAIDEITKKMAANNVGGNGAVLGPQQNGGGGSGVVSGQQRNGGGGGGVSGQQRNGGGGCGVVLGQQRNSGGGDGSAVAKIASGAAAAMVTQPSPTRNKQGEGMKEKTNPFCSVGINNTNTVSCAMSSVAKSAAIIPRTIEENSGIIIWHFWKEYVERWSTTQDLVFLIHSKLKICGGRFTILENHQSIHAFFLHFLGDERSNFALWILIKRIGWHALFAERKMKELSQVERKENCGSGGGITTTTTVSSLHQLSKTKKKRQEKRGTAVASSLSTNSKRELEKGCSSATTSSGAEKSITDYIFLKGHRVHLQRVLTADKDDDSSSNCCNTVQYLFVAGIILGSFPFDLKEIRRTLFKDHKNSSSQCIDDSDDQNPVTMMLSDRVYETAKRMADMFWELFKPMYEKIKMADKENAFAAGGEKKGKQQRESCFEAPQSITLPLLNPTKNKNGFQEKAFFLVDAFEAFREACSEWMDHKRLKIKKNLIWLAAEIEVGHALYETRLLEKGAMENEAFVVGDDMFYF